ncbi:MAG: DUF4298 domain-containing protein, partial [Lachnospiraceae bacterium]|nr:DUF4298 domain-containing protein [Lachnospiraceae bacterium]
DHDYESFPQDTELRRNFYRYLNDGKKMGSGYGILFYHPEMERINRITKMEQILDAAIETSQISGQELKLLTEYYEGPLWREDFEADEAGRLPKDLKRGVLSEDAVYNLLEELSVR